MNNTLSLIGGDAPARRVDSIVALAPRSFVPHAVGDRLTAFKTHFVPTRDTLGQKIDAAIATVGIYAAVALAARVLGTTDVSTILHALHLNGV